MAQSGRNCSRSTVVGDDYIYNIRCDLCEQEGDYSEADYCADCQEYIRSIQAKKETKQSEVASSEREPAAISQQIVDLSISQNKIPETETKTASVSQLGTDPIVSRHKSPSSPGLVEILYNREAKTPTVSQQGTDSSVSQHNIHVTPGSAALKHNSEHRTKPVRLHGTDPSVSQRKIPVTPGSAATQPSRETRKTRALYVMDIEVRSGDDSDQPNITGIVVLPGDKLVLTDSINEKVKLIDLVQNCIVSQLKLPGDVYDVTQVNCTQVAVSSKETKIIYFVNVEANQLKIDREVKINGECWGIAYFNNKFVVIFLDPLTVEIISMKGNILQTLVPEDPGSIYCICPYYVAVSRDQNSIYISDMASFTVTKVDLTGQVQARFSDYVHYVAPYGLTTDSAGRVYVCGWFNSIRQLSADLTEVRELLQESDGVVHPTSICYCDATDRLFIGMWRGAVKVFQLI